MNEYCLTCTSTADLSKEYYKKRDIRYTCFHFTIDGEEYLDDMGGSMPAEELYMRMNNGSVARTSQVTIGEFENFFGEILDSGRDILHLSLSSGISGEYNSACAAAGYLKEKYPERKLYVVDSLAASSGFGLIMDTLADKRDEGAGIEELKEWITLHRLNMQHWFFPTNIRFLVMGGRVSRAAGAIANILNIYPLLNVDFRGALIAREKIRGKTKIMKRIIEKMKTHGACGPCYSRKCFISNSMCPEDAGEMAAMIEREFEEMRGQVSIYPIGATIGCHTGPGTVAVFFWGDKRTD